MDKIKGLFNRYKEVIMYLIFGVLTTLINIVSFYISDKIGINTYVNNTISWVISVLFAFVTNKLFVFGSKDMKKEVLLKEGLTFFGARVFSYFVDMGTIYVMIDLLHINKMISKIVSNVIVVVINYVFSKLIIFKKK